MKLEKVNDNQIRCILSKEDLEYRQIKISEIAYGSTKAKMLFKDVMQQASYEFGFEADNIPLMIEAIPMSTGSVVFIITKVSNPEELDTRFSRFAPSVIDSDDSSENEDDDDSIENDSPEHHAAAHIEIVGQEAISGLLDSLMEEGGVRDLFKKIASSASAARQDKLLEAKDDNRYTPYRLFAFDDLDNVGRVSKVLDKFFEGESSLYKDTENNQYIMLLERGDYDKKEFLKVCNLMLEYGSYIKTTPATVAYAKEHFKCLLDKNAVSGMAKF